MIALSCNDAETHNKWIKDIQAYGNLNTNEKFAFPIIDDKTRHLANLLGMIDPDEIDSAGMPVTARSVINKSQTF